jgi:phosphoglycolate phosphatase-like HAD superfamily hydrolase
VTASPDLARVLAETSTLLLDFDGPICKIFSSTPSSVVAQQLSRLATSSTQEPHRLDTTSDDPLDVLRAVGALNDQRLLFQIEQELRKLELEAAETAEPTQFAALTIRNAVEAGRKVAIVSNNSADAIEVYVNRAALRRDVSLIVGRPFAAPERMKPHPEGLMGALAELDVRANDAVFLGDSVTDIAVAHLAGTRSIAFANRQEKIEKLRAARPDALIVGPSGMAEVAAAYAILASS